MSGNGCSQQTTWLYLRFGEKKEKTELSRLVALIKGLTQKLLVGNEGFVQSLTLPPRNPQEWQLGLSGL